MSLRLENVSLKVDGETHIYPTDLTFDKGSMNVLLGATGAGKTTLMRIMAGLTPSSTGKVFWDDNDVTGIKVQNRDVSFVYQQFINYPTLSVFENIASPLRLKGARDAEIDHAVKDAARLMKLEEYLERTPLELSGGQQQRCALARALVKGAGLVLLDEPLANLDYKLREELRSEIPVIFEKSGSIFVYATTDPEEALLLGGNTVCLKEGRVTQYGKTSTVYHNPGNILTADVFSSPPMNFTVLEKKGGDIRIGGAITAMGGFGDLEDGIYKAGFRPNHMSIEPVPNSASFEATLNSIEITGSETFLHLTHEHDKWTGLVHGVHDLPLHQEHKLYVASEHIYLFDGDGVLKRTAQYAKGRF